MHSWLRERKRWYSPTVNDPLAQDVYQDINRVEVLNDEAANLVSSNVTDDVFDPFDNKWHLPCIDLDFEAHLEPSTTPGHFHLFLNKHVTWDQYLELLDALYNAGLIEYGFWHLSRERGGTFVRMPGTVKPQ
jgi:hypothetical protein